MNSLVQRNKIIWAIDTSRNPEDDKDIITELKIWSKQLNCDVQPVSVFSKSSLNLSFELPAVKKEKLETLAQKSVNDYMKKSNGKGFLAAEIIFTKASSKRKLASELAKYAENKKSLMIFANTRAQKTWSPFRLGSFAETLVATSKVPVLLHNPATVPSANIPSILFPTDFSHESKNALLRLQPWAKKFKSKIIIYNQVETPNVYYPEVSGLWPDQVIDLESLTKRTEMARIKKATDWLNDLKKENIDGSILVQRQRKNLGEAIIETARKHKASLIALTNHTGPVAQSILGGVARDVLLLAKCPVLIFYKPTAMRKRNTPKKRIVNEKFIAETKTPPQAEIH